MEKPQTKPKNPCFGSGPCAKRPGYSLASLDTSTLGRSHRSKLGLSKIQKSLEETRKLLVIPSDYLIAIVPASDTGAVEMAMWSLLGPRPVDVVSFESFGKGWYVDIATELKLEHFHLSVSQYGLLPDLSKHNPKHDLVFTWNGTTSGVKIPNGDWISDEREGVTICDATSAIFAMPIPWIKVDVLTYSWQKVLGGEAAHGILILGPRAVQRLESYKPSWPLPKIFRLKKGDKINQEIFEGTVINTVSMLCVEDYLDALKWATSIGGLEKLIERSNENLKVLENFVAENDWIDFLAKDTAYRSNTSVCFSLKLDANKIKDMTQLLSEQKVAFDINSYRDAPAGLRIWAGATVEKEDLELLTVWLKWAYHQVMNK